MRVSQSILPVNNSPQHDALHVASVALEANPEEKDVSKQIKVPYSMSIEQSDGLTLSDLLRPEVWTHLALHRRFRLQSVRDS